MRSRPRPLPGYRLAARLGVRGYGLLAAGAADRKAHLGRLAAPQAIETWAHRYRDPQRPLVWIHASSVGEGLQARAVLGHLTRLASGIQTVATRYSASAELIADRLGADHVDYAPYDRREDVERCLHALRPNLMVFTKDDVWTEMATAARRHNAQVALVAGTVNQSSSRLRWPARLVSRAGYAALDFVAAVSTADADRLVSLGAPAAAITVTGDPRVDSAIERVEALGAPRSVDPKLLVAGSTWRDDEQYLLEALTIVRDEFPEARLLLVPHQPDPAVTAAIISRAVELDLPTPATWRPDQGSMPISIMEGRGMLAELYRTGGIGYVGGGFGGRGIHSVLEPAASGVPVIVGPQDRGQRDVALLMAAGGLRQLPTREPAAALADLWSNWLREPGLARRAGIAARTGLEPDRGAAEQTARLLTRLL